MCFVASLIYTLLFHGVKLWYYLTFERKSMSLGTLAILKTVLLAFDLLTNGLLLYKVLVFKGLRLFDLSGVVALTLSVVGPSPIITLSTNGKLPLLWTSLVFID